MTFYSPKKVAEAIGVSEASLKRWCDKGLLKFTKTAGGHRRIPHDEVMAFLRDSKYNLVHPQLLGLPQTSPVAAGASRIDDLTEFIRRGDDPAIRRAVIGAYLNGTALHDIYDQMLAPLFREVGQCWEDGSLEIYQERWSCEICQRLLHELNNMIPRPGDGAPLAVGATLSGDPYTLAMLMAETILRQGGWRARSLGINLTGETLAQAIADIRPKMVWLSVSSTGEAFLQHWQLIWQACLKQNALLVVGGRALTSDLRAGLNYHCHCDTMGDLANFIGGISR